MEELANYLKADLILLAKEFEVEILDSDGARSIIKKIEKSPDYDKNFALAQIKLLNGQRVKEEKRQLDREERERQEKEREKQLQLDREERDRQIELDREERVRQFELEKLKLQNESGSLNSSVREKKITPSLKNMMHKFDMETSDISLYLNLFERQAKMADIEESEWVNHLLGLLPVKLAEQIIKLPEENLTDFEFVKTKLLERFKLNAEAFRSKFLNFQRPQGTLWKDAIFDLRTYLDGWLESLEIMDFKGLKDLMVADQLKKRATPEMKEKYLDSWSKLCDPEIIAEKFDDYESVRQVNKKPWVVKNVEDRKVEKPKSFEKNRERKNSGEKSINWRDQNSRDQKERTFEKPRVLRCYECNSTDHLRPACPQIKREFDTRIGHIVVQNDLGTSFEPYIKRGKVNDEDIKILRDSGAGTDLISGKLISKKKLTGESIWVRSPLVNEYTRLPLAHIKLELPEIGVIHTKAAVLDKSIKMDHYLMGNQSQLIVDKMLAKAKRIEAVVSREQNAKRVSEPQTEGEVPSERDIVTAERGPIKLTAGKKGPTEWRGVNNAELKTPRSVDNELIESGERRKQDHNAIVIKASKQTIVVHDKGKEELVMSPVKPTKLAVGKRESSMVGSPLGGGTKSIVSSPKKRKKKKNSYNEVQNVNGMGSEQVTSQGKIAEGKLVHPSSDPNDFNLERCQEDNLKEKCSLGEIAKFEGLCIQHKKFVSNDTGGNVLIKHNIELKFDPQMKIQPYQISSLKTKIPKQEIKIMMDLGGNELGDDDHPRIIVEVPGTDPPPKIEYRIKNKPGKDIAHADCLSRI